jgi:pilus assembly protein FimV
MEYVMSPRNTNQSQPSTGTQRTITASAALLALSCASHAWAIDVGGATVLSRLGEPLHAQIEVSDLPPSKVNTVTVSSAPPGNYAQAGLQYQSSLAVMYAVVRSRPDATAYIDIKTRDPITSADTDLLITVRSATGVLQREFALRIPPSPNAEPATSLSVVTVEAKDTASQIIDRAFSSFGPNVSANQALIALQRQNPNAFIESNINLVKTGAALTLPTTEQVQAVDNTEAARLMTEQRAAFEAYKQRLAANTAQATNTQNPTEGGVQTEQAPAGATGDRLELKAANEDAAALEALAQEQAAAQAAQREAAAQQRIKELQALAAELNNPASAGQVTDATALPVAPASAASAAAVATGSAGGVALKEVAATTTTTASTDPSKPSNANSAATARQGGQSFSDKLSAWGANIKSHAFWQHPQVKHPLFWPIALALLALLAWLFMPKRAQSGAPTNEGDPVMHGDEAAYMMRDDANDGYDHATGVQDVEPIGSQDDPTQGLDDADPLSKARSLWSSGFEDLAIHTLNQALAYHTDRPDYYMALLQFHRERGAQLAFEATARELELLVEHDSIEWQQCCEWGLDLDPDNSLYGAPAASNLDGFTDLRAADLDLKDKP